MSNLPVIYLAGPINGCTDEQANDWRTYVKENYDGPTLDPMRRDYRGREEESVTEIVELDKVDIEECGVFMANCPNPSYGTAMEIFYAWEALKPVVIIHPVDKPVSPWVRYHSEAIVHTLDDAIKAAKQFALFGDLLRATMPEGMRDEESGPTSATPDMTRDPSCWDDEHSYNPGPAWVDSQ